MLACLDEPIVKGAILSVALLLAVALIACVKPETVNEVRRGSLRCTEFVERRQVNNYWWEVFINDRPFIPDGGDSNKVGQCQASRNPNVKVMVLLLGDNCWTLRLAAEKPLLTSIEKPDAMGAVEQYKNARWSCNGRCLVWPTQMTFVDTNEVRKFPRLPSDFVTFSPDLGTAVTEGVNDPEHNRLSLRLIDMKTFAVNERILTRANYLWLLDYTDGVEGLAARFKWQPGPDGKDRLIYPAEETAGDRGK